MFVTIDNFFLRWENAKIREVQETIKEKFKRCEQQASDTNGDVS